QGVRRVQGERDLLLEFDESEQRHRDDQGRRDGRPGESTGRRDRPEVHEAHAALVEMGSEVIFGGHSPEGGVGECPPKMTSDPIYQRSRIVWPHDRPSAADVQPTTRKIARPIQRWPPTRAIGQPKRPDSTAIPSVDPAPNSTMYASCVGIEGSIVMTRAVSAPLPASP